MDTNWQHTYLTAAVEFNATVQKVMALVLDHVGEGEPGLHEIITNVLLSWTTIKPQ